MLVCQFVYMTNATTKGLFLKTKKALKGAFDLNYF
jgi:hypothetical protein